MEQFKLQKILKMGNSVSDFLTSELFLATFSLLWVLAILYGFIKFVLWRLWGSTATCRKAIQRSEKKRQDGFAEWRQMSETMDENKLGKYKEITDLPLFELRDALQSDNYTAVQVLEAYVWKMLQVHDRLNCCTEVIKEAFDTAKDADEEWHGKPNKPPLYGVPFSVKSNFHMRGYDCCVGLAKWLEQPLEDECTFVTFLKALGGVPFVLTNVPQGLLSFVCSNSVYGTTKNPHDLLRSPGGSSGGEAALLAGGGSPFGIGSDLAGSLRIPASFCGVVALKPTQDRFVVSGSHGGVPGRGRIGLSFGYFTKTVDEQISLLKMTVGKQEYRKITPLSPLLPLNEQTLRDTRPLRIGYFDSDGFCAPVPSMKRAVLETVEKLKSKGHTLVKFEIPDIDEAATLFYKLLMPDGGAYYRALYDNDIVDIYLRQFATLLKVPRCLRWMVSHLVARLSPQLALICRAYVSDLPDLRYTQEMCDEYRLKFIDYWQSLGLDALVCPAFPVAPVPHEYPSKLSIAAFATGFFNLVDFPAGVVPAGRVTHDDDRLLMDEKEFPCGYNLALRIQKDSNLTSVGLPCSVQIAALPFEEEVCLRVMKEVEEAWTQQLTKTE